MKTKPFGFFCGALALLFFAAAYFANGAPEEVEGKLAKISGLLTAPNGASQVFLDQSGVGIADAKTGKPLCVMTHEVYVNCFYEVAWSKDSRSLALVQQCSRVSMIFVARQGVDGQWKSEMVKGADAVLAFYRKNGVLNEIFTEKAVAFGWTANDELTADYVATMGKRTEAYLKKIPFKLWVKFGPGEEEKCRVTPW